MLPFFTIASLRIPAYGFFLAVAIFTAGLVAFFRCRKARLSTDALLIIAASSVGLGIVSAWALYVAVTFSFDDILALIRANRWDELIPGGMVYYGGIIGGAAGAWIGAVIAKVRLSAYLDSIVPSLPLAHAIGRLGCFSAGCCYGKPTSSWIGIAFAAPVGGAPAGIPLIPIQLIESALNLLIFVLLILAARKSRTKAVTLPLYLAMYGCVRFLTEFFRGDEIRGGVLGLSTSQWISLLCILAALLYLLAGKMRKRQSSR